MSPVAKNFRTGTDRTTTPSDTLARASAFTAAMGITRVANITGLDCIGIPVVMVCRPNSRSLAVSQGKGLDLEAARASGVMESIEFYHAERVQLPLVLASLSEMLQHRRVVDVSRLPRVRTSHFHADLPLLWIEGRNLLTDEPVWLPYEMLQLNMTLPAPPGAGCFLGGTNGLASGNHLLEAVSHAICEVVERDASTMLDLLPPERVAERRVDLKSVNDAACRRLLERYAAADVDVAVWDMTSDVGIAAFVCHIVDRSDDPRRALYAAAGMGCHPTRRVALLRALTEAAQERLALIAGTRDDLFRHGYERARSIEALRDTRALIQSEASPSSLGSGPGPGSSARTFGQTPDWDAETFDDDLSWELDRLRQAGIDEVVMVDLTRTEFQIPVVHVSIPGLESASWLDEFVPGSRARARTASQGGAA